MRLLLAILALTAAAIAVEAAAEAETVEAFGWNPQPPDLRDYPYYPLETATPRQLDLRTARFNTSVYDQQKLMSCVAHAVAFAHIYAQIEHSAPKPVHISRLALYYNARALEGAANRDQGVGIRSALQSANQQGVCQEALWPYLQERVLQPPSVQCNTEAPAHKIKAYYAVQDTVLSIKQALVNGHPVIFGFHVFSSFMIAAQTGVMPVPTSRDQYLAGHAVCAVGFNDDLHGGSFIVRNSYGANWGLNGHFYMPYAIVSMRLAMDFWVIDSA